jgi:very-short-patch-repair endonuclease
MLNDKQLAARKKGGQARAKQFTSDTQKAARACVKKSSLRANGRKGWAASMLKVDAPTLIEKIALRGRQRPTDLERIVQSWLDAAGLSYARQVVEDRWIIDFVVGRTAIECDGHVWHTDGDWQGYGRTERNMRKDAYLKALGYRVVRLSEKQIKNGRARAGLLKILEA